MLSWLSVRRGPETDIVLHSAELVTEADEVSTTNIIFGLDEGVVERALNAERNKALRAGHTVINGDGAKVWRDRSIIFGDDRREVWHEDNERIQCQWTEITMTADGERTTRNLRRTWVGYESAWRGV